MFKRFLFIAALTIGLTALGIPSVFAAGTGAENQIGAFTVSVGGSSINVTASQGITMSITTDDDTNTTSGVVTAVHGKGDKIYGMDTDGGPMYYSSVAGGTTVPTTLVSVTGSDDLSTASWTEVGQ